MIARQPEAKQLSHSRNITYIQAALFLPIILVFLKTHWFWSREQGTGLRPIIDFDAFYIVAQMVWRGEVEQAYAFSTFGQIQKAISGTDVFLPWTYPPQFDLLIAPLAFLPLAAAYFAFTSISFAAYLVTTKRIAGESFAPVLVILLPALGTMILCGQNGFVTGALVGLTCIGLQRGKMLAGVPLGLMIIKPHLAVGFAVYTLVTRRWGTAFIAFSTIAVTSGLATIAFGPGIWAAFLSGVHEARGFLEAGKYPLFRMISAYAALRTLGVPATVAFAAQALVALFALGLIYLACHRKYPVRQALGVTTFASLMVSPYAYDYDLPILGIGFALLLPDLLRLGRKLELAIMFGLGFFMAPFGLVQIFMKLRVQFDAILTIGSNMPLSIVGLAQIFLLGLTWHILRRQHRDLAGDVNHRRKLVEGFIQHDKATDDGSAVAA